MHCYKKNTLWNKDDGFVTHYTQHIGPKTLIKVNLNDKRMKFLFSFLLSAFLLVGGTTFAQNDKMASATKDITGVAMSIDGFDQLVGALKKADLVSALQADGPFTVFAPKDAAFEAISETVAGLDKEQLAGVLTYHVVSGKVMAKDVVAAIKENDGSFEVETLSGSKLTAMMKDGNVVLKDANGNISTIVKTDVNASNGVIHVIDKVLLP